MKKISIFMAPIIILAIIYGCSKDHDAPTFAQYEPTSEPINIEATYNSANDEIVVTWDMEDTDNVVDYLVAWSDSNLFDEGNTSEKFIKEVGDTSLETTVSLDVNTLLKSMQYYKADYYDEGAEAYIDSFIVYFTVSAVYDEVDAEGNDIFDNFIGPRAGVDETGVYADSALVLR